MMTEKLNISEKSFAVVDLSHLYARCRYVTKRDSMDERARLALHILFKCLNRIERMFEPSHYVFACYTSTSWRVEFSERYKLARRVKRAKKSVEERREDEIFFSYLNRLVNFIENETNCTMLYHEGIEADDFIAGFVRLYPDSVIVSEDSDFVQLLKISPSTIIFGGVRDIVMTRDGVFDSETLKRKSFGLNSNGGLKLKNVKESNLPDEWYDYALFLKTIKGDPGDGVLPVKPWLRTTYVRRLYEAKKNGDYEWINFLNSVFDGKRISDLYEENRKLVDLTYMDERIVKIVEDVIRERISKNKIPGNEVGNNFRKFLREMKLNDIGLDWVKYARIMTKGFPR